LMASVVLDEPSLGLSPVLVTEIFRCPMAAPGLVSRVTPVHTAMRSLSSRERRAAERWCLKVK
jgi:hypothetical protein